MRDPHTHMARSPCKGWALAGTKSSGIAPFPGAVVQQEDVFGENEGFASPTPSPGCVGVPVGAPTGSEELCWHPCAPRDCHTPHFAPLCIINLCDLSPVCPLHLRPTHGSGLPQNITPSTCLSLLYEHTEQIPSLEGSWQEELITRRVCKQPRE